jgi:RimJ/RimL family protein N-acetyltransferase
MEAPGEARIRGRRVWLRALEDGDLPAYKRAVNSAEVGAWAGFPWPHSDATIERWWADVRARHGQGEYWFAISPLGRDAFIGTVWLWSKGSRLDGLELSIFVTAEAGLGVGLGSDAVDAALDFIFGSYETERVWLTTEAENLRAVRAFEKCGFKVDGTIRHHFRREGRWRDSALMAITRDDWRALERPRGWDLAAEPA